MLTVKYNRGLLRSVAITVLALQAAIPSVRVGAVPLANGTGQSAAGPQFSVEVLVVVDQAAYLQWLGFQNGTGDEERDRQAVSAINDFVRSTFVSANLIWKGMEEYDVRLDLRIQDIRVIKNEVIVPPDTDGKTVLNDAAYWAFFHWLIQNGYEYDHALLLTGLNLISSYRSNDTEGYAYMNTMCSPESVSLVENVVNGIPAVVVAHEMGHSFGARHDGDRNACNATSGFIMNDDNIGTSPRHWQYSRCSARKIADKLQQLSSSYDCLSEGSTRAEPLDVPYLGQLYTADELCQMSQGRHSYVCRHLYGAADDSDSDGGSGMCDILWCLVNATYCTGIAPVDGLPCGAGKRCLAGKCVPFDDVPDHVTDTCYTGDLPHPAWRNQTCREVVTSFTHMCLDEWYTDFCCRSCQDVYTGSDVCPYGDAHSRCAPFYCGTEWENECCVTCPP